MVAAQRWAIVQADARYIADRLEAGDSISHAELETMGDATRDELRRMLARRGLRLANAVGSGAVSAHAFLSRTK